MRFAFSDLSASKVMGNDKPRRNALQLDFARPASFFGPVLFLAFWRLARICFSVAIGGIPFARLSFVS
jgi:hypothetical protein